MAGLRICSAKSKELTRLAPIWACLGGVATSGQWVRTGLAQCERDTEDGAGCGQVMKGHPSLSKPAIADRPVMGGPKARRRAKVALGACGKPLCRTFGFDGCPKLQGCAWRTGGGARGMCASGAGHGDRRLTRSWPRRCRCARPRPWGRPSRAPVCCSPWWWMGYASIAVCF